MFLFDDRWEEDLREGLGFVVDLWDTAAWCALFLYEYELTGYEYELTWYESSSWHSSWYES